MPVDLNPHQDYLIREFAEEYLESHMTRRDMMRRVLLITGSIPATASLAFTLGCGTAKDEAARATATATAAAKAPASATAAATATGTPRAAATPGVPVDDPALEAADIRFPGPAGELRGYLARPRGAGTFPGVLIIHENRGLLDQVKDIARRYAKEGFVALAIDLVSRAGGTNLQDAALNTGFLGRANPDDLVADCLAGIA
jgi:carboxymethylenebutenolidase